MKIIGNYDVDGNIKLRGRILNKVVTDGGFYSRTFGELAYKSDIVSGGSTDVGLFYGIAVKQSHPDKGYGGINTINFDANYFYLSQNTPNTDEVVVNLRTPRQRRITSINAATIPVDTADDGVGAGTVELEMMRIVIPANMLSGAKIIKGHLGWIRDTTDNINIEYKWYINDTVVYQESAGTGGADRAPKLMRFVFSHHANIVGKASMICYWSSGAEITASTTVVTVGHGTLSAFGQDALFGFANAPFDATVQNILRFTVRREATINGPLLRSYASAELVG